MGGGFGGAGERRCLLKTAVGGVRRWKDERRVKRAEQNRNWEIVAKVRVVLLMGEAHGRSVVGKRSAAPRFGWDETV
jgi:hypothetical protein